MLIHKIIEEQTRKTPEKLAVVFDKVSLTYAELNQKANDLAYFLQNKGVKPETLVAISIQRSIDLIIAILGIIKAGGAYVPIDPAFPTDRCKFILKDTNDPLLLTTPDLKLHYSHYHDNIMALDEVWAQTSRLKTENPDCPIQECHLAYVIYTSGSTGEPKGVLIEHKGIANLALSQAEIFKIDADSQVLQFASISFDASVSEWSTALSQGATLCIPNIGPLSVGDALAQLLVHHPYTVATIPPSVLAILPDELIAPLKTLVIAGEPCGDEIIQKWKNKLRLINAYGPTEYTVCATTFVYSGDNKKNTIGKSIPNTYLYVLDENLKPVTAGEEGELCLEGIGRARGYLNRPDLTQSKFLPNYDGKVIYRTGDRVCLLPDGNLQYLGRMDDQVKINGYRIDLSEIENKIRQLPWIQSVIVLTRVLSTGNKQLVAFIIPHKQQNQAPRETMLAVVKQNLTASLPRYLIPNHIVVVEEFPFTIQGKLDKEKLLEQCNTIIPDANFTAHQRSIAKIWQAVLEIDVPSVTVSFFDLGGNSLLLYTMQEELQQHFQMKFDIADFFLYPTIEGFSKFVLQQKSFQHDEEETEKDHSKLSDVDQIRYVQ